MEDYLQSVYNYLDGKDGLDDKFQKENDDEILGGLKDILWRKVEKRFRKYLGGKKRR